MFHETVLPGIRFLPRWERTSCWSSPGHLTIIAAGDSRRCRTRRLAAPGRVNGIAGDDEEAVEKTLAWLSEAPGITGQLLSVQTG